MAIDSATDHASSTWRLAVLIAFTGDGGVEKMVTNLLQGFVANGVSVDLLLLKARGSHLERIPPGVRVHRLEAATSIVALPALIRYLRRERPDALLVAKDRASRIALLARRLSGVNTRLVLRMGMHLSGSLQGKSALRRWSRFAPVRWLYPWADRIITVSGAIAEDFMHIAQLPPDRFAVIRNPTVPENLETLTAEPVAHPWLARPRDVPVILGVGRLTHQKGFDTLLQAHAQLLRTRPARLILLGEGPDETKLRQLAAQLGSEDHVNFVGFQSNPYAWMARADLFVLSSRFEGSPNVLVEAMAAGTPVVATDCPSGPHEILRGGSVAPLVAVDDWNALASAISRTLDTPPDPEQLRDAVEEYHLATSTQRYLEVLGCPQHKH